MAATRRFLFAVVLAISSCCVADAVCLQGYPDGLYPAPGNGCNLYHRCHGGRAGPVRRCGSGKRFSLGFQRCMLQELVACSDRDGPIQATAAAPSSQCSTTADPTNPDLQHTTCGAVTLDIASHTSQSTAAAPAEARRNIIDWIVKDRVIPCNIADQIVTQYEIDNSSLFSIKVLNDLGAPEDTTFTILSASKGVTKDQGSGWGRTGKLEFLVNTKVVGLTMGNERTLGFKNLYIGTPINYKNKQQCGIKLELPNFTKAIVPLLLPQLMNGATSGGSLLPAAVTNLGGCIASALVIGGAIAGGVACISVTFGVCAAPIIAGLGGAGAAAVIATGINCNNPSGNSCMPADARVYLADGSVKAIEHVKPGDVIMTRGTYANSLVPTDVYLLGHDDKHAFSEFVAIKLEHGQVVELSPGHFIPVHQPGATEGVAGPSSALGRATMKRAADVRVGDTVVSYTNGSFVPAAVRDVSMTEKWGLYNPFTLTGDLIVNDVLVSAHSDWFLDRITPAAYADKLPGIYQAVMAPMRVTYKIGGLPAIKYMVDSLNIVEVASKMSL